MKRGTVCGYERDGRYRAVADVKRGRVRKVCVVVLCTVRAVKVKLHGDVYLLKTTRRRTVVTHSQSKGVETIDGRDKLHDGRVGVIERLHRVVVHSGGVTLEWHRNVAARCLCPVIKEWDHRVEAKTCTSVEWDGD